MSRPVSRNSQSAFATMTSWEALGVESGEETEEEQVQEPVTEAARYDLRGLISARVLTVNRVTVQHLLLFRRVLSRRRRRRHG